MADFLPDLPRSKASLVTELVQKKRARDREAAFVLEGGPSVLEILKKKSTDVRFVVLTSTFFKKQASDVRHQILRAGVQVYQAGESHFERISDVENAQGVLAVVCKPVWHERSILAQPRILGIFGERLQDPANVGTIIRTAAALQVTALWLTPDSADVFSPKIVRATAGSILHLPIFRCRNPEAFAAQGCTIVAGHSSRTGSVPIREVRTIPLRTILAVGNESKGLTKATLDRAAMRIHIPLNGEVESLNVATATAILVFHLTGLTG